MKLSNKGFTLAEVLLAAGILAFALCGILLTYINMYIWSDLSRDFTLATNAVQLEMEEIRNTSFGSLLALNGTRFDITGLAASDAEGVIFVNTTQYPDLMQVRIVASFRSRGRVIGEDANLDGVLQGSEDTNGNTRLDSPIEMVTLITQ